MIKNSTPAYPIHKLRGRKRCRIFTFEFGIKTILCILLLITALGGYASAEQSVEVEADELTNEIVSGQYDALDLDELYDSVDRGTLDMLDGFDILDTDFSEGIGSIFSSVGGRLGDILKKAAGSGAVIMAIAMLCSLVSSVYDDSGQEVPSYVNLAGILAIAAVTLGSSSSFLGLGLETLNSMKTLADTLLPAITTLATATGAYTSAAVKYMATVLFMDILLFACENVFMPIIYAYIAVSIGNAAFGGGALAGAASVLKWMANMILTVIMIAFVAYISISGVVASSTDVVTARVAKTVLSTAIPVVGSIISDAAASVVAGASVVKSAVGVFGVLVILAMSIVPFLRLGASYLMYKLISGLSSAITSDTLSKLVGDLGAAFGMVMGMVGAGTIMMFFSILSLIKVVGG